MHDQIRDMGRMIVKEEGHSDPLKYSRPWGRDQLLEVLGDAKVSMGNPDVQGIDFHKVGDEAIEMSWKDIEAMQSLRMIIGANDGRCFVDEKEIIRFPSNLRWFNWNNCPYETLAFYNDQHEKICVLELIMGDFEDFRSHSIAFPNLKVLDLSGCSRLIRTPDFTHFPSLQKLVLDRCRSLTKIDESIGHLKELVELSMEGYNQISVLPDSIGSLQSLEKLDLTGCVWLEKVPDSICGLKRLSDLSLQHCELLERLPNSMGMLTSLKELKIDYCTSLREVPNSLADLNNELQISLKGCNLLEKLPKSSRMSANYSLQFVGLKRPPDSVKPVEEKTGPSTATPHKHQLKRKKSFEESEENREQIKRRRMPFKRKERPSTARHFDVFISFRGEDTRNGFISHLYKELTTHGITTFIEGDDLKKGEKIEVLFKHIEGSKIFMPVFSKDYADSKWCLREITRMVEIYKREGKRRPIIPIFYHVDPSDVRYCWGSFREAFKKHQQDEELGEEEINEWKTALKAAGEFSGYCLSKTEGNEAKMITKIRKRVSDIFRKVPFDIQPVGITLHPLKQMLEREKAGVCMIGICGLGGIGKTTLAMALYNELFPTFEGSCFLSDIRSKSENREGLPNLQKELINKVLRGRETKKIANVEQGVSLIKQLLGARKILLILDDVAHKNQIAAFTADRRKKEQWFGKGSKIIVTTRDKTVLVQHGLQEHDDIYFPEGLDREDSLQLFCHHAFASDQPLVGFEELSLEVVKVADGLPLALKVFGPLFYGVKEKKEWEEKLEILKREQKEKVHVRLKISYDSLSQNQRSVFLDIACFFIGWDKEKPVYMWEGCGYFPNDTLKVLQHKSLIKINVRDVFEMHDQIRDMGRMIVKEEGNSNPLRYSRPWNKDQMLEVLRDAKFSLGNPYIQGIHFDKFSNEEIDWRVIEKMPSLRMITCGYGKFRGLEDKEGTLHLPRDIGWLEWKNCPYQTLTFSNNKHEKLGVLDLSYGDFRDFRSHRMEFPKLKILNLSDCHHLVRTPDFTNLLSLEVLRFDGCESLTQMDESIGQLDKLVELSLGKCKKLKGLPAGLCKLSSLESLELSECQGISILSTQIGDLTSLEYLGLERTSISNVPDSIGNLQSLENLNLAVCKRISVLPTQIGDLTSLKYLNLRRTSISDVPDSIGRLQNLEELNLSNCSSLKRMPDSIGDLESLSRLYLNNCRSLEQLPNSVGMLPSLEELRIHHCKLLREVPDSLGDFDDHPISIEGCISLEKFPNFFPRRRNNSLIFDGFKSLRRLPDFLCEGFVDVLSLLDCELLEALPDNIGIGTWSSSLRILQLSDCTLVRTIPESIGNLKNLERLRLSDCQLLKELPECIGRLLTLKELDLSGWTSIKSIPEFIGNLERLKHLSLQGCQSLEKLPECTCRLLSLEELDLSGCTSLISIPESIGYLKGLKLLNLQECRSLKELPESLEGLIYLKVLHIYGGMSVKKVPDFIGKLTNLEQLYLREFEEIPDSIGMLPFLKELHLSGFSPLNCQLPKSMEGLKSLSMLCICGGTSVNKVPKFDGLDWLCYTNKMVLSELEEIPELIAGFSEINDIVIEDCPKLESLPQLPSSLTHLWIQGCAAFRKLSDTSTLNDLSALAQLHLVECKAFTDLSGLASLESLRRLALADWDGLSRDLMDKLSQASFESLSRLLIWGARDGSDLLFGLPKSNVGKVWRLHGRCFLTEELPSYTSDINIRIQVLVEGKVVTEVTCTARREEEIVVHDEADLAEDYYTDYDEDNHYFDELYDTEAHERWRLEGRDFYSINYKEGDEVVKWVEKGNTTLRVLTTYNHYGLRMAFFAVQYCWDTTSDSYE